jgi:hypothetical protein
MTTTRTKPSLAHLFKGGILSERIPARDLTRGHIVIYGGKRLVVLSAEQRTRNAVEIIASESPTVVRTVRLIVGPDIPVDVITG